MNFMTFANLFFKNVYIALTFRIDFLTKDIKILFAKFEEGKAEKHRLENHLGTIKVREV